MLIHYFLYGLFYDDINLYCYRLSIVFVAGQLPKAPESVPGFQMHSEDFPALPGSSTKSSGERKISIITSVYLINMKILLEPIYKIID